jgi:hypothetical protein
MRAINPVNLQKEAERYSVEQAWRKISLSNSEKKTSLLC